MSSFNIVPKTFYSTSLPSIIFPSQFFKPNSLHINYFTSLAYSSHSILIAGSTAILRYSIITSFFRLHIIAINKGIVSIKTKHGSIFPLHLRTLILRGVSIIKAPFLNEHNPSPFVVVPSTAITKSFKLLLALSYSTHSFNFSTM